MHAHAAAGRTTHALRVYKALWDLLDEDYGMEPSAATQKLVADIKMGLFERDGQPPNLSIEPSLGPATPVVDRMATAPSVSVPPRTDKMRLQLSILPVDTQELGSNKAHLVAGFRRLLIASLIKFREWQVTDVPFPPTVSGHGAARYEIQMFAHQSSQIVQLTVMLKELDSGFYIWSDGFELTLNNWFDSQRRVVRRVAMALNVYLSAERLHRFSEQPDISLGVFDRWLRCQTLVRTFDPKHWSRLTLQFTEIIADAPLFVPAYCGLADLNTIEHIAHPGVFRSREREQKALELGRKAVQLDPADMHAHRCLAWAYVMTKQYAQAQTHIEVACELIFGETRKKFSLRFIQTLLHLKQLFLVGHQNDLDCIRALDELTSLGLSRITLPDLSVLLPLRGLRNLSLLLGGTRNLALLRQAERTGEQSHISLQDPFD
jgi:TolB-like protein